MTAELAHVQKAIALFFDQVRQRPETPRILGFNADGEALLARDVLLDGIAHAARLRAELDARNVLIALVTNGTLVDRAFAVELARQGVVVTVSLDGAVAAHDRHRVGPDGAPTYGRVLAGIAELRAAGIPLSLRAVITPETAPTLTETYHALQALGPARPIKLRPVRLPPPIISAVWIETFTEHYLRCIQTLLTKPGFPLVALPDDAYYFAHYILGGARRKEYCSAGRAMLWMTPTGYLTACGLFTQNEQRLGHIDAVDSAEALGALLEQPMAQQLRTSAPSTHEPCRSCRWLPVCGGGCPALIGLPGAQETPPLCAFYMALGAALERLLAGKPHVEIEPSRAFDV